jgi:hypothetical protein
MKIHAACFCFALFVLLTSPPSFAERPTTAGSMSKVDKKVATPARSVVKKIRKGRRSRASRNVLTEKQKATIAVYEACVRGSDGITTQEKLFGALDLAFAAQQVNPLRGSPQKLGTEICVTELLGLSPFESDDAITVATESGELSGFSFKRTVFDPELSLHRRAGRSWVPAYIDGLEQEMSEKFPVAPLPLLRIPSVVRTKPGQQLLFLSGRSPARCDVQGLCSTHTTGAAIDISLLTLNRARLSWLKARIKKDITEHRILAILEAKGGHFHVFVLPPEVMLTYRQARQIFHVQR